MNSCRNYKSCYANDNGKWMILSPSSARFKWLVTWFRIVHWGQRLLGFAKKISISLMRLFLNFHQMTYVRDIPNFSVLAALGSTKKPPGHPTTYDAATTEKTSNGLTFKLPFCPKFCIQFSFWKIWVVMQCNSLQV